MTTGNLKCSDSQKSLWRFPAYGSHFHHEILLPNQSSHGKEKLSVCRWPLFYWTISLKIHCTCYQHWDHLFFIPPVPTLTFLNFQDRSKNFPRTIKDLQKSWKQSHRFDQCQMWLPSETSSGRKEWPSSPNLPHPEQLNQQNIDIDVPWRFSAWNERGWSHSSSYQDHIYCWEKQETTDFRRKIVKVLHIKNSQVCEHFSAAQGSLHRVRNTH